MTDTPDTSNSVEGRVVIVTGGGCAVAVAASAPRRGGGAGAVLSTNTTTTTTTKTATATATTTRRRRRSCGALPGDLARKHGLLRLPGATRGATRKRGVHRGRRGQ